MAAIFVSQNNETAAMLVSQTSPVGVELFSYVNAFFCSSKFAYWDAGNVSENTELVQESNVEFWISTFFNIFQERFSIDFPKTKTKVIFFLPTKSVDNSNKWTESSRAWSNSMLPAPLARRDGFQNRSFSHTWLAAV